MEERKIQDAYMIGGNIDSFRPFGYDDEEAGLIKEVVITDYERWKDTPCFVVLYNDGTVLFVPVWLIHHQQYSIVTEGWVTDHNMDLYKHH